MKKTVLLVTLVAVAALGVVGTPILLQRLDAAKMSRTVADVRTTGTAMFSWLTDEVSVAPDDQSRPRTLVTLVNFDPNKHNARRARSAGFHMASASAEQNSTAVINVDDYKQISPEELTKKLVPRYIAQVPVMDAWGHPYEYFVNDNMRSNKVLLIRSAGKDGVYSGSTYTIGTFERANVDEDVVWADGFFVRSPQQVQQQ